MAVPRPEMGSQRRVVTVLFADVVGFTAIAERLDPEVVTDAMNDVFALLGAEVAAVGGHVDKVIGDSLMAVFGAPVAHEDDPHRAVRAALAMQRAVAARGDALARQLGQPVRLRIGLHTGPVVWGQVGPAGGMQWTVMGDAVNLASRLQRAAPEGGVLISEAAYRQVRGAFQCRPLGGIEVRGKAEPVTVYEVIAEGLDVEPVARPPFVDREPDLAVLGDLCARAVRGRAQVAMVVGDPGVGKTRLVEEFVATLPEGTVLLRTACPPYGGQSLAPLADLFRQFAGLPAQVTVQDVAARIPLGERSGEAAVVLSRLFGLAEVPPDDAVSRETALLLAAEAIRRMLVHPTVVWIEDLHWADAGTREVLPFIVERLVATPLLVVGTLRAGEEPPHWGRRTATHVLQLEPLGEADGLRLLQALAGGVLPPPVARAIVDRAGGNPFYLNELVATLRHTAIIVADERGQVEVRGTVEGVLPDTIHAAVLARLDRLPAPVRELLQVAAVAGTSITRSLLEAVGPGTGAATSDALAALEAADLLACPDPLAPDPTYQFTHPLVRDVAYASLLTRHQGSLHLRIAEALERLAGDGADAMAKPIGTHFLRGGAPDRALPYLHRAGSLAADRYAVGEAVGLLEQACTVAAELGDGARRAAICEVLGELYPHVQGRSAQERLAVWQAVIDHVDPAKEPARAARALVEAADARVLLNAPDEAQALLARAEPLLPADHPLWSAYHRVRSRVLMLPPQVRYEDALAAARRAVEIAERVGGRRERNLAYGQLSHPALLPLLGDEGPVLVRAWVRQVAQSGDEPLLGDATLALLSDAWTRSQVDEEMIRLGYQALQHAEQAEATSDEARLRTLLGWIEFLRGQWHEAQVHLERARGLVEAAGGQIHEFGTLIMLPYFCGNLALARGQLEEARAIFAQALVKPRFHAPIWLNHDLAVAHLRLGDLDAARDAMARALEARDRLRCIVCGCQANGIAAEFFAAIGQTDAATAAARLAAEGAARLRHVVTRVRVDRAQARLALRAGDAASARAAADAALARLAALAVPRPYEVAQAQAVLGEAMLAAGQRDDALAVWEIARTAFDRLGAAWDSQHARRRMEEVRAGA
ncbi:MAG: adenylate/guanylate cyclase domain-containing protein [Armatimonadota bacterium]|nr:adenylate/guanylate cyclase domain-containing protein [Armatimonadota bacterium]